MIHIQSAAGILILACISSCYSTQHIPNKTEIIVLSKIPCERKIPVQHFFSYYAGEKIDFEYNTLAVINAMNGNVRDTSPLELMKRKAVERCADGLIQIAQNSSQGLYKQTDLIRMSYDIQATETHRFDRKTYTGIAVKLKDSQSISRLRMDQEFIQKINKEIRPPNPCRECDLKKGAKGLLLASGGILLAFALFILIAK